MAWTRPRTWEPGEQISSSVFNAHVAANLQDIFDRYTRLRGAYVDVGSTTVQGTWTEVGSLSLDTRHEAILLTVIGIFPQGFNFAYRVGATGERVQFYQVTDKLNVAWQQIIPSLTPGVNVIKLDMQATRENPVTFQGFQYDIRELA